VLELADKLNVPQQALHPQLQQLKDIHPDFEWSPTESQLTLPYIAGNAIADSNDAIAVRR
ncbi:MAG: hypothetical protein AAFN08_11390, partial [Cyanobacteria bacterium J06559_3]